MDLGDLKDIEDSMGIKRTSLNKEDRVNAIIEKAGGPGGRKSEPKIRDQIRSVYQELRPDLGPDGQPEFLGLADVRERLDAAGISRPDQDKALLAMLREPGVRIIPVANRKALKDRDREAALRVGGENGQEWHAISIAPERAPEPPTPPPPTPSPSTPASSTPETRARRLSLLQGGGEGGEGAGTQPTAAPAKAAKKAAPAKKATAAAADEAQARRKMEVLSRGGYRGIDEGVSLSGDPEGDNGIMHGDSATMELAQAYAKKNRNGTANRLMELRRQISTQRGDDSKDLDGPQKMVDELKRLREAETDDQLRRRLDDAIEELDFPQTPVPDLPEGTPPALRKLLEDLNKIPVARAPKGSRLHGFTQEDDSPVESIAQLIRRVNDDNGQISIGQVERRSNTHLRRYHESIDGAYRMWGLSTRTENDNDLRKQLQEWIKDLRGKAQAPSSVGGDLSTPPRGVTPGRARGTAPVGTALPPNAPPRSRVLTRRQVEKIRAQHDLEVAKAEMRSVAPNDGREGAEVQARMDDAQVRIDQTAPGRGGYNWNSPWWDEPAAYHLSGTPTRRELQEHVDRIVAMPPKLQAGVQEELVQQAQLTPRSMRDLRVVTESVLAFQGHENAYAIYQSSFRSISFNPRWSRAGAEFDASWDISKDINYHPPSRGGTVKEIVAHEYGHHLVYRALQLPRTDQAKLIKAIDDSLDGQGWLIREFRKGRPFQSVVDEFLNFYGAGRVDRGVSGYAKKNYQELLAEIWAEFSTMRAEARPPAASIGAVLMELAEKLNIIQA